jgi:hypothetical protein
MSVALLGGCTGRGIFNAKLFKERAAETPVPSDQGIEKTFFRNADGSPKLFLCAWSPELGRGFLGEALLTRLTNEAMHCNIIFDITENYLVGKMVNPSFPKKYSAFKEVLKIRINKHYYYERARDAHGRETNEWIENDSRSDWSARPMIKLDLTSIDVKEFMGNEFGNGVDVSSVEDIEWDKQNNFLGFSLNMSFSTPRRYAKDEYQGRIRFNFLKFDHDDNDTGFKVTPYAQENSRFMNILHVMGNKIQGTEAQYMAAHWDLRKPTKIYISGAPSYIAPILVKAVERWNTALREIGAIPRDGVAFIPEIKDLKHPFDLRYPSINWIQDKRVALYSPLGIGMAHADMQNGKILWGGVVLYGGLIEAYINRYAPVESAGGMSSAQASAPMSSLSTIFPEKMGLLPTAQGVNASFRESLISNMSVNNPANMEKELAIAQARHELDPAKIEAMKAQMEQLKQQNPALNKIILDVIQEAQNEQSEVGQYFSQINLRNKYGNKDLSVEAANEQLEMRNPLLASAFQESNGNVRSDILSRVQNQTSPFFIETDRSILNMSGQWNSSPAQLTRSYPEILESVVMELALHEVGHMVGLGHQFKENIVPEAGTVPSKYVRELSEKATAAKEFTNYSSVMGYKSGRVEMLMPINDINPGPHDKLVLRYLYNQQYTAYDKAADAWVYPDVPASGRIPMYSQVKNASGAMANLPTSYFPQCNDYEASLDADPFCNRWDRGSKAEDIVASYFQYVSDNLLTTLYSLVGGGGAHWMHEAYLWRLSINTFQRVRLFYDEMRRRLRSEDRLIPIWDRLRQDKDALFEFSEACQKMNPSSPILKDLFKHKDIVDLCRANALAMKEFGFFLNLPEGDYTRIDHTTKYISGGYLEGDVTRNYGNIMGSWFQLSNYPLKFMAMYTLTSADAFFFDGWWFWPNMYYDNEENRFLYRTLYPRDYTKRIAEAVQNNMRFAALGMDNRTSIGKTILTTSWLLPWQKWTSNDAARLPRDYNDMLDQQTQFNMSMVAVIVNAVKPDANAKPPVPAEHYKKFTASVYDFFTGKSSTAREVYILPKGDVLVWANGMFIYPITKLKFYEGTSAYVIAYKVSFDSEEGDNLVEDSVKTALLNKHDLIAKECVDGVNRNGLSTYFNDTQKDFQGFYIPPGIAEELGKEKTGLFYESLETAFKGYDAYASPEIPDSFPIKSMRQVCDEAVRGIGQITATSALVNGYWLRITPEYLEK